MRRKKKTKPTMTFAQQRAILDSAALATYIEKHETLQADMEGLRRQFAALEHDMSLVKAAASEAVKAQRERVNERERDDSAANYGMV